MVKGYIIRSEDAATIRQIKIALTKLPAEMASFIENPKPLEVIITPATDKVKLAMYKDKLEGKNKLKITRQYLNVIIPFFRQHVRNIKKMEVVVYD